jgi:hypothetical protein
MDIGKLFNRCGCPGISPISCLLEGKSIDRSGTWAGACAESAAGPRMNAAPERIHRNFEFMVYLRKKHAAPLKTRFAAQQSRR